VPIYEYQCDECGAIIEVLQKMSDDPLETCEECGGSLRKILHPVAIHFKGSGFYTTDYGKGSGRRSCGGDSGEGASSSDGAESAKAAATAKTADSGSSGSSGASGTTSGGDGKAKEKQKTT
jgi:putative FmdB family regulatory protein